MIRPKSLYLEIMRNKVEKVWSVWSIPTYRTSSVMASVLMNVVELGHEMNQSCHEINLAAGNRTDGEGGNLGQRERSWWPLQCLESRDGT